jgi:hypothetical protein
VKTKRGSRRGAPATGVTSIAGVALGEVVEVPSGQGARVDFPGNPAGRAVAAVSTVPVTAADVGRAVALGFQGGDPALPIVLGFVWYPDEPAIGEAELMQAVGMEPVSVVSDGERVVIEAAREITLRCGRASITLTRAGKILLRGAYLLSRSTGVNRIKGASVQIN